VVQHAANKWCPNKLGVMGKR